MKKDGSASAVPSFSRSCVIAYLMFQQKVYNVLLTDPATIDPQQRIRGQNKLFVVIRDGLQRRKFPICVFRRKNIADLVSKQLVAHLSSARDNRLLRLYQNGSKTPEMQGFDKDG